MRKYKDEFWINIERLHKEEGKSLTKLAKEYHFDKQTYYTWRNKRDSESTKKRERIYIEDLDEANRVLRKLYRELAVEREKVRLLKKVQGIIEREENEKKEK